jgi:hypothetical protein
VCSTQSSTLIARKGVNCQPELDDLSISIAAHHTNPSAAVVPNQSRANRLLRPLQKDVPAQWQAQLQSPLDKQCLVITLATSS